MEHLVLQGGLVLMEQRSGNRISPWDPAYYKTSILTKNNSHVPLELAFLPKTTNPPDLRVAPLLERHSGHFDQLGGGSDHRGGWGGLLLQFMECVGYGSCNW